MLRQIISLCMKLPPGAIRRLRCQWVRLRLGRCGRALVVDKDVNLITPEHLYLGDHVVLNRGVILQATGKSRISVGSNVVFSYRSTVLTAGRSIADGKITPDHQYADVSIGNNVWICANAVVLPGAVIEDNVIVAAGAVARGVLRRGWIYGGVPAHPLKETDGEKQRNE